MKEFDEMYNRNLDGQSDQQEPQQADVEIPVSRQNQWQDTSAQEQPAYSWQPAQSQPRQESIFGESQNTVKIDLSGGAQPQGGSSIPGMVNGPIYTEHVQHQKKEKKTGKRFVAAMVSLTVLNLALFGGAFMLGRSYGAEDKKVASKQELVNNLKGGNSGGATETANTGTELATTEIAKQVGPAVVGITSVVQGQMSIFGSATQSSAQGSGMIHPT